MENKNIIIILVAIIIVLAAIAGFMFLNPKIQKMDVKLRLLVIRIYTRGINFQYN